MDIALWILIGMVAVAAVITLWRGRMPLLIAGLKEAVLTFKSMWYRLVLGFTLGGLIQVLIPSPLIAEWLGPASGLKGILIASYAGIVMTGGPFVTLPIIASIYAAGAGPGPIIALLASMNMLSLPMILTWEIPFLGVKIAVTRYIVCLFVPPVIGLAGASIFQLLNAG
ncbi:MAG: permease [Dehalococcoidales bacterium]